MADQDATAHRIFQRYLRRPIPRHLAKVVRQFHAHVWQVALRATGNETDAADVTQDVFLSLLLEPPLPERVRSPAGYLSFRVLTVAARQARSAERRRRREEEAVRRLALEAGSSPDEDLEDLRRAVASLPERLRVVTELRYIAGCSVQEIAGLLELSERSIAADLQRAREQLKTRLAGSTLAALPAIAGTSTHTPVPTELLKPLLRIVYSGRAIAPGAAGGFIGGALMKTAASIAALVLVTATAVYWSLPSAHRDPAPERDGSEPTLVEGENAQRGLRSPPPNGENLALRVPLARTDQLVSGLLVVLDEEDSPVTAATATYRQGKTSSVLPQEAPGEFRLVAPLPRGSEGHLEGAVVVEADGFLPDQVAAARIVKDGSRKLILLRSHRLLLRVGLGHVVTTSTPLQGSMVEIVHREELTSPLPGVELRVFLNDWQRPVTTAAPDEVLVTDADGTAVLDGLCSTDRVAVYAISEERSLRSKFVEVKAPFDPTVLLLEPLAGMRGLVVDENGSPVAGADVWISNQFGAQPIDWRLIRNDGPSYNESRDALCCTRADEKGQFTLCWKTRHRPALCARFKGYVPVARELSAEEIASGNTVITLQRSAVIRGFVQDAEGQPVGDATFYLLGANDRLGEDGLPVDVRPTGTARAPSVGRFTISSPHTLEEAQRLVVARRGAWRPAVVDLDDDQRRGRRAVVVTLERDPDKPVRILFWCALHDALTGSPLPPDIPQKVTVRLVGSEEALPPGGRVIGQGHRFELRPGEYLITADAPGFLPASWRIDLVRGRGTPVWDRGSSGCEEEFRVVRELERDPSPPGELQLPQPLWIELVFPGSTEAQSLDLGVRWKAVRLPHRSRLFDRSLLPELVDGKIVIRGGVPPGEYENRLMAVGYRDVVFTTVLPDSQERLSPAIVRVEFEPEWKDTEAARAAIPHLVKKLRVDVAHRGDVARALARIGADILPAILELLEDPDPRLRSWALAVLGDLGRNGVATEAVVSALRGSLVDEEATVRGNAASYLGRLDPKVAVAAVPSLIAILKDDSVQVRCFAADALGSIGYRARQALPHLKRLLEDTDETVADLAFEAIWRIESDRSGANVEE